MPVSDRTNEFAVKEYITAKVKPSGKILDVGPGAGLNYEMLKDTYSHIDGVEIFEPYVERFGLRDKYTNIFVQSVVDFESFGDYDLVIMGDVLEHLTVADSVTVLERIIASGSHAVVQVPFEFAQGMSEGNVHEIHIQDDLTESVMKERYGKYLTMIRIDTDPYGSKIAVYVSK